MEVAMVETERIGGGEEHRLFVSRLTAEEKLILTLRADLYEGDWGQMERDLSDRLQGKPYLFKLTARIREDLERMVRLRQYEGEHGISLLDFLEDDR